MAASRWEVTKPKPGVQMLAEKHMTAVRIDRHHVRDQMSIRNSRLHPAEHIISGIQPAQRSRDIPGLPPLARPNPSDRRAIAAIDERIRPPCQSRSGRRPTTAHQRETFGPVALVEPAGDRGGELSMLGGCVDLEPSVHVSSGQRLPGSGSRRR